MYSVSRLTHPDYGSVIKIERVMNGIHPTPFRAVQQGRKEQRLLRESGAKKVRFLIDEQVMSAVQAEAWADEEYANLPKCEGCAQVMGEDIFTHRMCPYFFCTQACADRDYNERLEKLKDEEEIEYL
jgi:hypothetical protein